MLLSSLSPLFIIFISINTYNVQSKCNIQSSYTESVLVLVCVLIMSHMCAYNVTYAFEVNLQSVRTHSQIAQYRYVLTIQINHLASLAKWFSLAKWLWIRIALPPFLTSNIAPVSIKEFLGIQVTTVYRFTLKRICDIINTKFKCTI